MICSLGLPSLMRCLYVTVWCSHGFVRLRCGFANRLHDACSTMSDSSQPKTHMGRVMRNGPGRHDTWFRVICIWNLRQDGGSLTVRTFKERFLRFQLLFPDFYHFHHVIWGMKWAKKLKTKNGQNMSSGPSSHDAAHITYAHEFQSIWIVNNSYMAYNIVPTNIYYWPSARSRWLDIGLVLFLRFYGPRRAFQGKNSRYDRNKYILLTKREVKMAGYWLSSPFAFLWTETKSRSIKTQKQNSANIQPSWPN